MKEVHTLMQDISPSTYHSSAHPIHQDSHCDHHRPRIVEYDTHHGTGTLSYLNCFLQSINYVITIYEYISKNYAFPSHLELKLNRCSMILLQQKARWPTYKAFSLPNDPSLQSTPLLR